MSNSETMQLLFAGNDRRSTRKNAKVFSAANALTAASIAKFHCLKASIRARQRRPSAMAFSKSRCPRHRVRCAGVDSRLRILKLRNNQSKWGKQLAPAGIETHFGSKRILNRNLGGSNVNNVHR